MVRLTRQVRFAIPPPGVDAPVLGDNGYAGVPAVAGVGWAYVALDLTLEGDVDRDSSYLRNIKEIDVAARKHAYPLVVAAWRRGTPQHNLPLALHAALANAWPGATLVRIVLHLSPFTSIECRVADSSDTPEPQMVRLSQTFEFAATHRLHNPALTDDRNRATFGKCNNPHGHGHNYQLQVTIAGKVGPDGTLLPVGTLERVVDEAVIDHFDHKNLNVELPEFRDLNPSVENIAKVIYTRLKPALATEGARLASVTVWETPKTWCEYAGE
jgi:6-pyruvoyltetrahydropterin/6-carboxytetrahydropterin synthase